MLSQILSTARPASDIDSILLEKHRPEFSDQETAAPKNDFGQIGSSDPADVHVGAEITARR